MKRHNALFALAATALCAGQAKSAVSAADFPSPPAENACTEKDPRIRALAGSLYNCLVSQSSPLFASKVKPDAVADAAIDGCQTERAQATAFAKACGAPPYDTTGEREMIISMVEDVRSRADFLWNHGEAWQKGSCSPQDPTFWAAVTTHFKCMGTGDWREASQIRSLGSLGQAALAKCATKETPIRERVTQCQSADAAAIMSAYQAAAQEVTSIVALEPVLQQAMPKNASKALRADKLYYLRESYDACVIFETKARAVAGGDPAAILLKAAQICLAARLDLVEYAQQYLSPEERHAILSIADVEATNMAKLELEAVGIKTASPSDR